MPTLKIDDKEITVPQGTSIIEAAKQTGTFIPHYCYHPGLSVSGNCRMCLVEVEKAPKLQIACYTPVTEGMVVHTTNDRVKSARQDILEFLLINHPLDCPVCDQSGECELQNYYMKYGLYDSRFTENKVKKKKAVPVGPTVMLDAERCILCSRCVRFCDEVTQTHELGIVNRGDHSEIIAQKELNNPYSGNVVDICPVGALTDRDFRFKCRVWFLASTPSVCPGCSMGCNIDIHWNKERPYQTPGQRVIRLKPRFNADVNKWWICDEGRYAYSSIDEKRVLKLKKKEEGVLQESSWENAFENITKLFSNPESVGVILSTHLTNEDFWMAREVFSKHLDIQKISYLGLKKLGFQDKFLIKADKSPNTKGAETIGFKNQAESIFSGVLKGEIKTLFLFGHDLFELLGKETAEKVISHLENLIWIGSNENETSLLAHWVLPAAVYAEKDGTFTNFQGRVQRIFKAFSPLSQSKSEWDILKGLGEKLGLKLHPNTPQGIFDEISHSVEAFQGMSYAKLGREGMILNSQKIEAGAVAQKV